MMTSPQNWINNPLAIIEEIFATSHNNPNSGWEAKAVDFFKEHLKDYSAHSWIPSLNDVPLHYLKPNSLVKFRCFIQDMFDPEFYMREYETVDSPTNAKVLHCGKYKDVTECGVDFNSRNIVTAERQTFYCVPIPGESSWVKDASFSQVKVVPSTSYMPTRQKRSYEEDEDMNTSQTELPLGQTPTEQHRGGDFKRQETEVPSSHTPCGSHLDLNFPLPGEKGPSCLVKTDFPHCAELHSDMKFANMNSDLVWDLSVPSANGQIDKYRSVYEDWDSFKLNEVVEVYGILSVSPALSALADHTASSSLLDPTECIETIEEQKVHSPPASLVPRLHMLYAKKLSHNNPLLPSTALEDNTSSLSWSLGEMAMVKAELLMYFTQVLLGDALAAEYLILHLISSVYTRRDVLPLGKFTLNLSGCPVASSYTEHFYKIIQQLVPSSYYLSMSLQNMNQMRMVPKKDYVGNRLLSGALQLAQNTVLVLDETKLEQGQLDTTGVRNVTALGNVITWQKVEYDFNFHQMEFPCNINVLITSEGRSLLPSDCHIHLQSQVNPAQMDEYLSSIHVPLNVASQLKKFRIYLSAAQQLDYSISDDVVKSVEDDFVEMRRVDPQSMSAEDFHRMLVVARLLSLSLGQTSLSRDSWLRVKHIESLRRSRMEQHKCVNGNEQ